MRAIAIGVPVAWASVSLFVTRLLYAKTAERKEILLGADTLMWMQETFYSLGSPTKLYFPPTAGRRGFDVVFAKLL